MHLERCALRREGRDLPILLRALGVGRSYVALAFEYDALLDHQAGGGDVAVELAGCPDLEPLARRHVARYPALDHHRVADDLRAHDGALTDGQRVQRRDLTLDVALDAHRSLEGELTDD